MLQLLKNEVAKRKNQKEMFEILEHEDFRHINNIVPNRIDRVIIVIRRMLPYSGGYTSLLRLGTQLALRGKKVIYAITSEYQSVNDAIKAAKTNLSDYQGQFKKLDKLNITNNDILIATYWRTAYQIKKLQGYKMYFIQDFEPYFSVFGEEYLLAEQSYNLGFHMVSLGKWNKYMIENIFKDLRVEHIDFPYEQKEYPQIIRNYADYMNKKRFQIAAFVKEDSKRIPNIVISLLGNLAAEFEKNGCKLEIKYFGMKNMKNIKKGQNLGVLNKNQLFDLYKESDFGISASMTNVSLVPYEMLATGLPLIEFERGSFPFFFPDNCAILTDFCYKNLYEKLIEAINSPSILEMHHKTATQYLSKLSWNTSGQQFADIIERIVNQGK